ncbi:hypothetical protein D3C87_256510 [compost metagenome]
MKMATTIRGLLLTAMITLGASGFAQQKATSTANYNQGFRVGFGLNAGAVTGDYFNWSLGADARLQYDFSKRTSITLTTGYTHLFGDNDIPDLGFIPVKGGFKAFVWDDEFYVLGEVGAGFSVTNNYDKTAFIWAPGIGYATKYVDISVRYEGMGDFEANQIALRLAYGFRL